MEERRLEEARSLRRFFHEQWCQFGRLLDQRERVRQRRRNHREQLDLAVSNLLGQDGEQRRIRLRYRERLRKGAAGVLIYIDQLVNELPPPRCLPYDHPLLRHHELRPVRAEHSPGVDNRNYFIRSDQELFMPAFSEEALRAGFKRFLFDDLVAQLRVRFSDLQSKPWIGAPEHYLERMLEILSLPLELLHCEKGEVRIASDNEASQERCYEMVVLSSGSVRAADEEPEQCHQL